MWAHTLVVKVCNKYSQPTLLMRMSPCLWVNMVNVSSSFSPSISDVYTMEVVLSNINQVQGRSFDTIIDCLKAMFVAPYLSNELRSLYYNKIKIEYVSSLPITFNNNIIFELLPICFLTSHFGQIHGQQVQWSCLVQGENLQHQKHFWFRI